MTSVNKMAKQAKKADKRREAHIEAQRQTGEFTPAQLLMQQEVADSVLPEPRVLGDVLEEQFGPVTSMADVVAEAHAVTPVGLKLGVKEWAEVEALMAAAAVIAVEAAQARA